LGVAYENKDTHTLFPFPLSDWPTTEKALRRRKSQREALRSMYVSSKTPETSFEKHVRVGYLHILNMKREKEA
jgi:hypothetical protein